MVVRAIVVKVGKMVEKITSKYIIILNLSTVLGILHKCITVVGVYH